MGTVFTDGQWIRKEIKMLLSAREMYIGYSAKKPMFILLDKYFEINEPVREGNGFNIPLTNELCKIFNGYSFTEIKKNPGIAVDFKNNTLGNMYLYANQDEDHEFRYDVKYMINEENAETNLTLILRVCKVY